MIPLCVLSYASEMRENFRVSLDITRELSNSFAMDRQAGSVFPELACNGFQAQFPLYLVCLQISLAVRD